MDLERTGLRFKVLHDRPLNDGHQVLLQFGNGYGASIVRGPYTYGGPAGLYELGVVAFEGETDEWHLTYKTPLTDDVLGYLTEDDVVRTLTDIHNLPPAHRALNDGGTA